MYVGEKKLGDDVYFCDGCGAHLHPELHRAYEIHIFGKMEVMLCSRCFERIGEMVYETLPASLTSSVTKSANSHVDS